MNKRTFLKPLLRSFSKLTTSCLCLLGTLAMASANGMTIEAENFTGMSGIQTENTADIGGGKNIGFIDAGDWMTYPINIPSAGKYTVSYRVASMNGGGLLQLEQQGGSPAYGSVNISGTGGWQTWVTISHVVTLSAGQQNIALAAKTGGFNINWFSIEPISPPNSSAQASSTPLPSSSAATSSPSNITLQAESYTQMNGVQTETTQDSGGGLNVGWTDTGDWMTYSAVNLPCSGTYTVEYRVASGANGGTLTLEKAGGSPIFGSINITGTGGWQTWKTVSHDVVLPAGSMNFGIAVTQGGWNLNWFRVIPKCNVASSAPRNSSSSSLSPFSSPPVHSDTQCVIQVVCASSQSSYSSNRSSSSIIRDLDCNGLLPIGAQVPCSSSSAMSSDRNRYDAPRAITAPIIDGVADTVWNQAPWAPIDVLWASSQAPTAQDFAGRYKAMWDAGNVYLLFDITDDKLLDATADPLARYWDDDSVEIFIDENKSGGNHQFNTSAWAYHISTLGDVVDSTNGSSPVLLNNHFTLRRVSVGNKHMWEMSMRVYGENHIDNAVNTPVALFAGKLMGFSAAYNDNDASSQRESMMGSVDTQGHKDNMGYIDASVFGSMRLIDVSQPSSSASSSNSSSPTTPKTVVFQAEDYARASDLTPSNTGGAYRQGDVDIEATTDTNGGYNVGWIDAGETLEFDGNFAQGFYDITARVASKTGGSFTLGMGENPTLQATVPNTGDWQTWQTIKLGQVFLLQGTNQNTMRMQLGGGFNLNWIQLTPNCASDPSCIDSDKDGVRDEQDQCPNTPSGAQVDDKGCIPSVAITAKAAAQAMGKGFNLGQMFESTQHAPTFANAKAKIDAYYDKGFRNVRIPITWTGDVQGSKLVNDANVGDVNLSHPRLAVIKQVVDYALAKPGMYVVINAHHEGGIKDSNQWAVLERLWQDISGIFVARDHRLMYEFLNEPHHGANDAAMNPNDLRNMVGKAYNKVRAIDPQRIVIIGGNQWYAANEMAVTWPHLNEVGGGQDKYIMAEHHHYNPWAFNGDHQGDYSDNWTDADVTGPMDTMANWANSVGQGMPVYIGEWGSAWGSRYPAMQCNNIRLIYKTLGWQYAPAKGQPTAVWDDGGWFKMFEHGSNSFANNLVDCIGGSCTWDGADRFNAGCK